MALKLVNLSPSPNPAQAQVHFIDVEKGVEGPSVLIFVPFLPTEEQTQEEIMAIVKAKAKDVLEEVIAQL